MPHHMRRIVIMCFSSFKDYKIKIVRFILLKIMIKLKYKELFTLNKNYKKRNYNTLKQMPLLTYQNSI